MQKQKRTQIHRRLRCSDTNRLLTSRIRFFDTRRETILKSLSYQTMLTTPQRSAHLVVQCQFLNIMVSPQLLNITVGPNFLTSWSDPQLQLYASMADNPTVCLHVQSQLPTDVFLKILKFSGPSLLSMTSFTLKPHFLSGFLMTIVILISFARERKLYPILCTWTKSRIVQSPTKLNDKI